MGCCFVKHKRKGKEHKEVTLCIYLFYSEERPELFQHTSLIDEDNNFYIDHNERLGTVMEVDEVSKLETCSKHFLILQIFRLRKL